MEAPFTGRSSVARRLIAGRASIVVAALAVLLALALRPAHAAPVIGSLTGRATITTTPEMDESTRHLLSDGNVATGLVFKVGTEGEGTITFTLPGPRRIQAVRLYQGLPVYHSTAFRIAADRDGDGVFETELARVVGEAPLRQWAEYRFDPLVVRAVCFESLAGVSEGKRAHPVLGELEIIGEVTTEDQEAAMKSGDRPIAVPFLKPMVVETVLARDGQAACAITAPATAEYRALAARLSAKLKELSGADVPVVDAAKAAPEGRHVIALGQMIDNPLIERLYWNRYTFLDSLWPGPGGWVIQSVHNPYPWTAGRNVLLLGGSDVKGTAAAVDAFLASLKPGKSLSVGHRLEVRLGPDHDTRRAFLSTEYAVLKVPAAPLTPERAKALVEGASGTLIDFRNQAVYYLVTGETAYLQAARKTLLEMCALYEKDPARDMTWPEETNSRFIFAMWDAVEEAPLFSDEERLRVTNMLLKFLHSLVPHTSDYGNLEKNETIVWNHTTFPLMGLYWGGRYFRRYYDSAYMETYLAKAAGAFRGQERSWKPQCDADSYLTLTIGHTVEYALAEGKMGFFTSGNIRRYADYLMGICDNRGWAAGFGDSGMVRTAGIPLAGLPYAFWYTRDPRLLGYLNGIDGGAWPNPYHTGVKSEPPSDLVGMRVYPLDRQVYDYTKKRPYYSEPSGPPNVPYEQAFDKIAFRAGLGVDDQFFLLDGYARGKHLHYDGNAILKLTDAGEDWLVDGDYLVRNTTEHNMVSVIRDGRCAELVPVCAGLLHGADLPRHALSETVVRDYNGVDWRRGIFWRKGDFVVVLDRMQAKQPGEYRFDCVWKTLDRGTEELQEDGSFTIRRGDVLSTGHQALQVVEEPTASAGKAVLFGHPGSQWQWGFRAGPGRCRVTLVARGPDTSSDSFNVRLDGGEPVAYHLPVGAFGKSSQTPGKEETQPVVELDGRPLHTATVTLREGPGAALDRVLLEPVDGPGKPIIVEAEDAPAPESASVPRPEVKEFHVVSAGPVAASVVSRQGSSGLVKMLHQRIGASLAAEQDAAFINLLYRDAPGARKPYRIRRVSTRAALLETPAPVLLGAGDFQGDGVEIRASLFLLSPETLSLADATAVRVGDFAFSAASPVSLEADLRSGKAFVRNPGAGPVRITLGRETTALQPGQAELRFARAVAVETALRKVSVEPATASAGRPGAGRSPRPTGARPLWEVGGEGGRPSSTPAGAAPPEEIRDVRVARLRPDGPDEVLVCRGSRLECRTRDGALRWTFLADGLLRCVAVADVDGDGRPEVLCGGNGQRIHVLDAAGKELRSHRMTERLIVGQGGTTVPYVNCLLAADLDGDGKVEIAAGCSNSQLSLFSAGLERLWNTGGVFHGCRRLDAADVDGDGKLEVLAADHYGSVHVFRAAGGRIGSLYSELGNVSFDVVAGTAPPDPPNFGGAWGGGKPLLVNASATGAVSAGEPGKPALWQFNNYGYAANDVKTAPDSRGRPMVLIASATGYVYALGLDGKPLWQRDLGSAVLCLAADGQGLYAGCHDGGVRCLSREGEVRWELPGDAPVKLLRVLAGPAPALIVVDREERLRVLAAPAS